MTVRPVTVFKLAAAALGLLLAVGIAAPYVQADQYGERLRGSLERALGRQVEFRGKVRFSLFRGGFTVEDVVIHDDPSIGLEPIAYMDSIAVRPSLLPLLAGRFVVASIRLEGASINLIKSGPASEWGRWNFAALVNRSLMSTTPAVHVRSSRINFKFGDVKSVFYLTDTDLDISPPGSPGSGWRIACSAKPARTDRAAQGLGAFTLSGHWYVAPERLDLDLELDKSGLGEITALARGQSGGVHGQISARLHLAGPLDRIGILGRMKIEDVHRWDLLPPGGQDWPLDIRGRLDLASQQIELESSSASPSAPPLWVRFRVSDYLSRPHWAVAINWNRFPVQPLMELAVHMGMQLPPKLALTGFMDGAIGDSEGAGFQGTLAFHDTALAIPDSPPVRFEHAYVVLDQGHARLTPALVRTNDGDAAQIEADYAMEPGTLDLGISTDAMPVAELRAQVALAAVPWLSQVAAGQWRGQLHYHLEAAKAVWTGDLELRDARIPLDGLTSPLEVVSAHAQIDGARLMVDKLEARAGKIAFTGDYRYEPGAARPHRVRLRGDTWDAGDLEAELLPTLRREPGLIARAFGRTPLPEWLRSRAAEGTVQLAHLRLAGADLSRFRAHLVWAGARVTLDTLQARIQGGALAGDAAINLAGPQPAYKLTAQVRGVGWQSGKLDAAGTLETAGIGPQLLANLNAKGDFTGTALDFGPPGPWHSSSGTFSLAWSPTGPKLTGLSLRTEGDTYTGRGSWQDDGRLLVVLTNGAREMRLSGPIAKLRVEDGARP